MAGTFFDSFMPLAMQSAAQLGPAGLQGQVTGRQLFQELAMQDIQRQQAQQQMEQQRQLFPIQRQQAQVGLQQQPQMFQAELGYKQAQAEQARAYAKMFGGGMYPPGSIREKLQRDIAQYGVNSPEGQKAQQELNSIAMAPLGGQGVLITPPQMQGWVEEYVTSGGQIKPPGLDGHDAINRANQALFNSLLQSYGQPPVKTELRVPGEGGFPGQTPAKHVGPRPSLSQNRLDYQAVGSGLRALGTRTANFGLAQKEFIPMAQILRQMSEALPRSGVTSWNEVQQAVQRRFGDAGLTQLDAAVNSLMNIYVRAVVPSGTPTESVRDEARKLMQSAFTQNQVDAVLKVMEMEIGAAGSAPPAVQKELHQLLPGRTTDNTTTKQPERPREEKMPLPSKAEQGVQLNKADKATLTSYMEAVGRGEMGDDLFKQLVLATMQGKTDPAQATQFADNLLQKAKAKAKRR